jgi:cytoskeleton-associated protein 5
LAKSSIFLKFQLKLFYMYRSFGTVVVPPPTILKVLPKIFSHSDKTVRAEGTQLTNALYLYLGPALEPFLADLKPVQVKELKEGWESMEKEGKGKGSVKPGRLTRAQVREAEERELAGGAEAEGEAADEPKGATFLFLLVR